MALVLADRVKETTTTTGTGTVTLAGASIGYQSFAAVGNGNTTYYCISGQTTNEWEVGIGTYTSSGTTLSRTTVLSSSNSGSLVTFSAGTKDVFVTYPSSRSIYADGTTLKATNSSILPTANGGTNLTSFTSGGVVYASSTSALATGSSLTFNGTDLSTSTGASSTAVKLLNNTAQMQIVVPTAGGSSIQFYKDNTPSYVAAIGTYNPLNNTAQSAIIFSDYTGSWVERMRLTSTGLGIGTSSLSYTAAGRGNLNIAGSGGAILGFQIGGVARGYLFHDNTNLQLWNEVAGPILFATNALERMRIDSAGNVGIGTSSPAAKLDVVGTIKGSTTIGVGAATPSTSGAGITFPATQSASSDANTLDDYEEGTWTPSVGGTATYTSQTGRYTKVGRLVTFQCTVIISLLGTGSTTQISGLPFTAAFNSANGGHAIYYESIDSNVSQIVGYIGTTNIVLQSTTAFAGSIGPYAIFKNNANITFQGFYFV